MSIKRPLCNYAGVIKELDAADVLTSEKVAVRITADGSSVQSIPASTLTRLTNVFKTAVSDPLSWWSAATHKFTPTKPGYYLVNVNAKLAAIGGGSSAIYVFKNNVATLVGMYINAPQAYAFFPVYLSGSGDFLDFYFFQSDTSAHNTTSSATENVIDILYVG